MTPVIALPHLAVSSHPSYLLCPPRDPPPDPTAASVCGPLPSQRPASTVCPIGRGLSSHTYPWLQGQRLTLWSLDHPLGPSPPEPVMPGGPHFGRPSGSSGRSSYKRGRHPWRTLDTEPSAHPVGSTFKTTPEPLPLPALLVQANMVPPCPCPSTCHPRWMHSAGNVMSPQLPAAPTLSTSTSFSSGRALASQLPSPLQGGSSSAGPPLPPLLTAVSEGSASPGALRQLTAPHGPPRTTHRVFPKGPSGPRTTPAHSWYLINVRSPSGPMLRVPSLPSSATPAPEPADRRSD